MKSRFNLKGGGKTTPWFSKVRYFALGIAFCLVITTVIPVNATTVSDNLKEHVIEQLAKIVYDDDVAEYDGTKTYSAGAVCIKDGSLQEYDGTNWNRTSVFQFAADGKKKLAAVLTKYGATTSATAPFSTIAANTEALLKTAADGKKKLADLLTRYGATTSATATFDTIANNTEKLLVQNKSPEDLSWADIQQLIASGNGSALVGKEKTISFGSVTTGTLRLTNAGAGIYGITGPIDIYGQFGSSFESVSTTPSQKATVLFKSYNTTKKTMTCQIVKYERKTPWYPVWRSPYIGFWSSPGNWKYPYIDAYNETADSSSSETTPSAPNRPPVIVTTYKFQKYYLIELYGPSDIRAKLNEEWYAALPDDLQNIIATTTVTTRKGEYVPSLTYLATTSGGGKLPDGYAVRSQNLYETTEDLLYLPTASDIESDLYIHGEVTETAVCRSFSVIKDEGELYANNGLLGAKTGSGNLSGVSTNYYGAVYPLFTVR